MDVQPQTEADWAELHPAHFDNFNLRNRLGQTAAQCQNIKGKDLRKALTSWIPILHWLPKYERSFIFNDVTAGVTNGVMNIPQGMAYGMLAGLDPAHGLYTTFFFPLLYAIFGSSKHVALGTFAIVALMSGQAVDDIASAHTLSVNQTLSLNGTEEGLGRLFCGSESARSDFAMAVEISGAITLLMGLILVSLSLLRMGFLALVLSDQLVQGLTSGAAIYVMTVQVKHLLGIPSLGRPTGVFGLIKFYVCVFIHIGEANLGTVLTSIIVIATLVFIREVLDPKTRPRIKVPIPGELIVVPPPSEYPVQGWLRSSFRPSSSPFRASEIASE